MIGGFAAVAEYMNAKLVFPGKEPEKITRQQVQAWSARGTVNQAGQLPPSPVREVTQPHRTADRLQFDLDAWVDWARPGVPGPRRKGWIVPKGKAGRPRTSIRPVPNPPHRPTALDALYREHAARAREALRT
jgi:hypothetical protein